MTPSQSCNDLVRDIEGWLLRYLTACAEVSPANVSFLEHRICGAVMVSSLARSDTNITELSATLNVSKATISRTVRRMIKDGRLSVLSDPDDDRIKRLQHRPDALEAALSGLRPLYDDLVGLLAGYKAVENN